MRRPVPAEQGVQAVAPAAAYTPTPQLWQTVVELESMSAVPEAHCVQFVAAAVLSVLVTDPAEQTLHAVVETLLNRPAAQAVHDVARASLSVSVADPAEHAAQSDCPPLPWYWPAVQSAQATCELLVKRPTAQELHDDAFTALSVLVADPAEHTAQLVCPALAWYRPAGQPVHAIVDALLNCPTPQVVHEMAPAF
jgi:hypothetical protein